MFFSDSFSCGSVRMTSRSVLLSTGSLEADTRLSKSCRVARIVLSLEASMYWNSDSAICWAYGWAAPAVSFPLVSGSEEGGERLSRSHFLMLFGLGLGLRLRHAFSLLSVFAASSEGESASSCLEGETQARLIWLWRGRCGSWGAWRRCFVPSATLSDRGLGEIGGGLLVSEESLGWLFWRGAGVGLPCVMADTISLSRDWFDCAESLPLPSVSSKTSIAGFLPCVFTCVFSCVFFLRTVRLETRRACHYVIIMCGWWSLSHAYLWYLLSGHLLYCN